MRRAREKGIVVSAVVAVAAVAVALALFEAYHRFRLEDRLHRHFAQASFWVWSETLVPAEPVDSAFGRRPRVHPRGLFKVDTTLDLSIVPTTDRGAESLHFSVRTNNVGLLSDRDYAFERDPARPEFRIVLLGESFTATSTATYQWVDTLEELLDASEEMRAAVGGRAIRTYNLGVAGGGFPTFARVFRRSGRAFDPDLVVVNVLEIDFPRTDLGPRLTDEDAMIRAARDALGAIAAAAPGTPMLVTVMPLHDELVAPARPLPRSRRLAADEPGLDLVDMRGRLPRPEDAAEALGWFNLPLDGHYSDRGGEIYARAMAALIAERVAGRAVDFTRAPSRFGPAVLGPGTPRNRPVDGAAARFAARPGALTGIHAAILEATVSARRTRLRPYVLEVLTGTGIDGVTVPVHRPVEGGFVPMPVGDAGREVALLNVACTRPPVALANADCYTFLHLYVDDRR